MKNLEKETDNSQQTKPLGRAVSSKARSRFKDDKTADDSPTPAVPFTPVRFRARSFVDLVHSTLDNFVRNYKKAPNDARRFNTDAICYEFIEGVTSNEAYQLGFKNYYDERKGGEK